MSEPPTSSDWVAVGTAVGLREPLDASVGSPPLMCTRAVRVPEAEDAYLRLGPNTK